MKTAPFYVYALSIDPRTLKAFEIFFSSTCQNQFAFTDDTAKAGAAVIDFDTPDAESKLGTFRETCPRLPVIVISLVKALPDDRHACLIRKPIKHTDFRAQLDEIKKSKGLFQTPEQAQTQTNITTSAQATANATANATPSAQENTPETETLDETPENTAQTAADTEAEPRKPAYSTRTSGAANFMAKEEEARFVGNLEDIDINDSTNIAKVTYHSKNMFQGALRTAVKLAAKNKCPVELIAFGIGVVVDPAHYKIHTAANDSVLRPICMLETEDPPKFRKLKENFREQDLYSLRMKKDAHLSAFDIDTFTWKTTLWSSRGRVPDTTDLQTPVYLSHWPNLTRLAPIPQATRIAALMVKEPAKLDDVAKKLQVPQRYVFGFYSAANALGLAGMTRRQVDTTFETRSAAKPTQSRSILSKLLGRLTGKHIGSEQNNQAM